MNRVVSCLPLLVGLIGCDGSDAPPPTEVRTRIATDLVAVADAAEASMAGGASLPDTAQFALVQAALERPLAAVLDTNTAIAFRARMPNTEEEGDDFDGAEIARWLNDNIFTDANHAGDGIYKIPASLACDDGEGVDPECAQGFDQLKLRIRVSENDDVLKFALQVGKNHDEPLSVALSSTLLACTVDLDEAEDAVKALAPAGELPPFSLSGEATAKLEITGAAAAEISLTIDRDLDIDFEDMQLSSKKAEVASLALDGNAKSMQVAVGLRETTARIADDFEGTYELDLPGMQATATYAEGQPLKITGISLGSRTTTVKVDGQTALAVDLNKDDGRKLDAEIDGDTLTVSPRLDLRSQVNHELLGDVPPEFDITRILVDGGLRARADNSVEVLGAFAIETNPASYGFSATAGQCVSETETGFAVAACN